MTIRKSVGTQVVAIIQARMESTRLPGKVLKDINGQTMLARVVGRVQRASSLHHVVVATTVRAADEVIVAECERLDLPVFRGDDQDVLDRYYRAAQAHGAQTIVRITADCPLVDPAVVDIVVNAFLDSRPDYASNTLKRTYPRGLDTEVISLRALECAWRMATEAYEREHVTPFLYRNPDRFELLSVTCGHDYGDSRWTVDTPEDLAFVREVYKRIDNQATAAWTDIVALLEREPALAKLNRTVQQKARQEA